MERKDAELKYRGLGLEVRHIIDEPGQVYTPHRHEGVFLFTLKGSAEIKLDDGEWQTTKPGVEVHIEDAQLHEAVSGTDGWSYLFAASPEEMERQEL
jgi:quercetin dioxygenase-like cupin family protein